MYALNNFDVHMIDLSGFGYSGGVRMAKNSIQKFQRDIIDSFSFFNPSIPLFLYAHSMGGLSMISFLINNPDLNVAGVLLSAPLLRLKKGEEVDDAKRIMVNALAP